METNIAYKPVIKASPPVTTMGTIDDPIPIELMISGKSVPMDASTRPIISGETSHSEAIFIKCSIALSLEIVKTAIPKMGATIAIIVSKAN